MSGGQAGRAGWSGQDCCCLTNLFTLCSPARRSGKKLITVDNFQIFFNYFFCFGLSIYSASLCLAARPWQAQLRMVRPSLGRCRT